MSSKSSGVPPSGRSRRFQTFSSFIASSMRSPGKIMNDQRRWLAPICMVMPGCWGSQNWRSGGMFGFGRLILASMTSQS